jgi:hypothetical protein
LNHVPTAPEESVAEQFKLPYRRAAELLNEMLPGLNRKISHTAIRRHTLAVGTLLDKRIIEPDEYASLGVESRIPQKVAV